MKAFLFRETATIHAGVLLFLCIGAPSLLAGQTGGPPNAYKAGRTPDGAPDLRGIWEARNTANWNIEGQPGQNGVAASKSLIVDPPNGRIPYQPEAAAKRKSVNVADDPQSKCFLAGVPRIAYTPKPFQIFQSKDVVAIVYQQQHAFRFIPTTARPHLDGVDFWLGDSRGRWEGDALVVDVVDFNDQTWFDHAGNFHSEDLHVVERYTRIGLNTMLYEALIEDPKVFSKPWRIRTTLERHTDPGFRIEEDACTPK